MHYFSFDVETANEQKGSICQIGIAEFVDGKLTGSHKRLINPQGRFARKNVEIHGITRKATAGEPPWSVIQPVITSELSGKIIVIHSTFDALAFAAASNRYGLKNIKCTWVDTLKMARDAWAESPPSGGFGLKSLSRELGIKLNHHDAESDAIAAGHVFLRAMSELGITFQQAVAAYGVSSSEFDGYCEQEASRNSSARAKSNPYAAVPAGPRRHKAKPLVMVGHIVVFTGQTKIHREHLASLAVEAGAEVSSTVTKKTTIVVRGRMPRRLFFFIEPTAKLAKAIELRDRSGLPLIIDEQDFVRMIGARRI